MTFDPRQLIRLRRRVPSALRTVPVPSPCSSVCRIDAGSGLCEGCLRSLDEIAGWSSRGEDEKRQIWERLAGRAEMICGEAGEVPAASEAAGGTGDATGDATGDGSGGKGRSSR